VKIGAVETLLTKGGGMTFNPHCPHLLH